MKIKSIKISNVLSFKYYEDLSRCQEIKFGSSGSDFHILIGPNGSGKSNFLEIINQIFKNVLFKRCQFNKTRFINRKDDLSFEREKNQILQAPNQDVSHLNKNWGYADSSQTILLSLTLNDNDYKNIDFIIGNAQKVDDYLQTYSEIRINFTNLMNETGASTFRQSIRQQSIDVTFSRNTEGEKFTVNVGTPNNEKNFIKQYLEYFEFLQSVIDIHNIEKPEESWEPLKDTFALISCYRNYNAVDPNYSASNQDENSILTNLRNRHYQDTTLQSKNEEPTVFGFVKHKLAYEGFRFHDIYDKKKTEIVPSLYETDLYKNINGLLQKFLAIDLQIKLQSSHSWTFTFHIQKDDQTINFQNLSAGQKGIIHLIFSLYGYDIKNGLFIIDEPELHLHPQLQRKYIAIAKQESTNRDIQFIVSTHSPIFVSEKTIRNVKRFYFDEQDKTSKVVQPEITEDDKFLIKVLSYTNASKIFFIDKAVLVEGQSDDYFFTFYINYLKDNNGEIRNKIDDFEIYNIEGKKNYENWKKFLEKWELKVFFIGDWDNVDEFNIVSNDDLSTCKQKFKEEVFNKINKSITDKNSKDGRALLQALFDYIENSNDENFNKLKSLALYLFERFTPYKEVINCLQTNNKLDDINRQIDAKYADRVYILKKGELEDYLNIQEKGLSPTIEFCDNFDESKLKNKEELEGIVSHIFS